MNYNDQSIEVKTGLDLVNFFYRHKQWYLLFTTQAAWDLAHYLKKGIKWFNKSKRLLKQGREIDNELMEDYTSFCDFWTSRNSSEEIVLSCLQDEIKEIIKRHNLEDKDEEILMNNVRVIEKLLKQIDRTCDSFWRVYNETQCGYSLDERDYFDDYKSSESDVSRGEVNEEEREELEEVGRQQREEEEQEELEDEEEEEEEDDEEEE